MGSVFYIKKILPFSFYYIIFYLFCQCGSAVPDLREISEVNFLFFEHYIIKFWFCQSNKCLLARFLILGSYRDESRSLERGKNLHIGVLGRDSESLRSSAIRRIMGIEKNRKKLRFSLKKYQKHLILRKFGAIRPWSRRFTDPLHVN